MEVYSDIIFKPNNIEEVEKSVILSHKYGYSCYDGAYNIPTYDIERQQYIIFIKSNDNDKKYFMYFNKMSKEEIIKMSNKSTKGDTKYTENYNDLIKLFINTKFINYNIPKELVYENIINNNYDEICVRINDMDDFNTIRTFHEKIYEPNILEYDDILMYIKPPFYIYIKYKTPNYICYSGINNRDAIYGKTVYEKILDGKMDINKIKSIILYKRIEIIDYNIPKELVYERKNIKDYNFIFYNLKTDEELIKAQEILILKNDYKWESGKDYVAYTTLTYGTTVLGVNIKNKTMSKYEYTRNNNTCLTIDNFGEFLILFDKYNSMKMYNEPKELIYENISNIEEICIKINDKNDLDIIKNEHLKHSSNLGYENLTSQYPYYLYINIKYLEENVQFDIIGTDTPIFYKGTFNKILDSKKNIKTIIETLKKGKISSFINYNEPKELVYESNMTYFNTILKKTTKCSHRIKTLDELKKDYSTNLQGQINTPRCTFTPEMHYLCGEDFFILNEDIEKLLKNYNLYIVFNGWAITKEMIISNKIKIDYNEPKELVYESNMTYFNIILKKRTKCSHRIKTLDELKKDYNIYSDGRINTPNNGFVFDMYFLFGMDLDVTNEEINNLTENGLNSIRFNGWFITKEMIIPNKIKIEYNEPKELVYENKKKFRDL